MKTIPQRELRNRSGQVLRDAEQGEEFIVTVDGRPVATLGPYRKRQWVTRSTIEEVLASPTDETWLDDIRSRSPDSALADPWERS